MIVKDVALSHENGRVVLSAMCKIRKIGWDRVYFNVAEEKSDYVCEDASPFAAVLLIPSMLQGEDLIVKGRISKQFYAGMHDVMDEVLKWEVGLQRIAIKADELVADDFTPTKTASFFSGGVDSFYTYLKHKNDPDPANRVDSLLLIKSFDVDPRNTKLWEQTLSNVANIAEAEDVEAVDVETNIHKLLKDMLVFDKADYCNFWDYTHGGCLAGVGLFLRRGFGLIYVPSTHSVGEQIPWGSNLAVDGHWSTETTTFVHDGTEATRVNKVLWQVSKSPVALKYLRVCYENESGTYNCGHCDKCLRTMINLYVAGVLDQSEAFPHELNVAEVAASPTIEGEFGGIFHRENLDALRERRMNEPLQQALIASMDKTISQKPSLKFKLQSQVIYYDHAYLGGSVYKVLAVFFGRRFA